MQENISLQENGVNQKQAPTEPTRGKSKLPRHPRWTIKDTLILIQAKQVVENRGSLGSVFGPGPFEPKWEFVSSFCKQNGVERGPVQCRKRWYNIICDFRKVRLWESEVREEGASFWRMGKDSRRESKLPRFFDREIYDLLDGEVFAKIACPLRSVSDDSSVDEDNEDQHEIVLENKTLMLAEKEWFEGIDGNEEKETDVGNNTSKTSPTHVPITVTTKEKYPSMGSCEEPISQEKRKRKKTSSDGYEGTSLKKLLILALEKNFTIINAQLEAHNLNIQLDRDQRKEQNSNVVDALAKIADAIERITDKFDSKLV